MNVLVVNCGSSSLKFQLRHVPADAKRSGDGRLRAQGRVQGLGMEGGSEVTLRADGGAPVTSRRAVPDHAAAARIAPMRCWTASDKRHRARQRL